MECRSKEALHSFCSKNECLRSGTGYTVLEMIAEMEAASGRQIRKNFQPRRPGDVPENFADASEVRVRFRAPHQSKLWIQHNYQNVLYFSY